MATKRSRPSKSTESEPASSSGPKGKGTSRSRRARATEKGSPAAETARSGRSRAPVGDAGPRSASRKAGAKRTGKATSSKGSATTPRAAASTKVPAKKTARPSPSAGAKAAGRSAKPARAAAPPPEASFDDVPLEPVRKRRRTVATPTGRRRIKNHRPAPHASAPSLKARAGLSDATDEASELAEIPTQTARGASAREGRTLPIEIDPERIEQSLRKIGGELSQWARRGRYTKVRFRFRGKPLLPDLPLAAVVAAEGLTFYWGGILRALLMNVAGGSLLDVELIHDAEKEIQAGKEALLSGELDRALGHYRRAVEMQPEGAQAHLNLGIALKLQGQRDEATSALKRALELDPEGPIGAEAKRLLERL